MESEKENVYVPESEPLAETQTEETKEDVAEEEREPIKTVNTFWERLDEVLTNLEETPQQLHTREEYKSALNQPRQLFCCSTQDLNRGITGVLTEAGFAGSQSYGFFDSFRVSFTDRALLNVKSIQLYSASIPQAQTNITNAEIQFFFYEINTLQQSAVVYSGSQNYSQFAIVLYVGRYYGCYRETPSAGILPTNTTYWYDAGTDGTQPNYFQLDVSIRAQSLKTITLLPSYYPSESEAVADQTEFGWNKTYSSYDDLLTEVNRAAGYNTIGFGSGKNLLRFNYNQRFNKFEVYPQTANSKYYVLPSFGDTAYQQLNASYPLNLNLRLGFTEQVTIPSPLTSNPWVSFDFNYIFGFNDENANSYLSASSYPNLNYTNRVNIFADVVRSSSFDTFTGGELLASVPMNTGNLGVVLYQAVYPNKLVNVPPEIYDIFFSFQTDNKIPYLFPKSATISLELALEYF
jgi:hypothetical protein